MSAKDMKILVAMSGGVDSSVAAALLQEQGYCVEGVTMCFELPATDAGKKPSCCGLQSIDDARRVCKKLGISHHVLNYGDALETGVIEDFLSEYMQGRTPNPCVRCNRYLKFERLFKDAMALGGTHLATGHYVRVEASAEGWVMRKAADPHKDQSYFLYGIPRAILPQTIFPLGGMIKDEVRAAARRMGLAVADKKDSQDICFIPEGDYRSFLASRAPALCQPGDFVDADGKKVGVHRGVAHYTVGQREGLGIALGYPAFVFFIDTKNNTVHVGPRDRLLAQGLTARALNLVSMNFSKETVEAGLKIRYNHCDIAGWVDFPDENSIRVRFQKPYGAVTPGQSVVFYRGDILLGGGLIDEPLFAG